MKHPRSLPRVARAALLISLIAAGACDDDRPAYETSCARNCDRVHECSSAVDVDDCTAACSRSLERIGPHLRGDYLSGIDACVAERSCGELALAVVLNSCPNEVRARLAPSGAAISFCDSVAASIEECVGPRLGTALCLNNVKIYSDATLQRAARCERESCSDRLECVIDAFGEDPTQPRR